VAPWIDHILARPFPRFDAGFEWSKVCRGISAEDCTAIWVAVRNDEVAPQIGVLPLRGGAKLDRRIEIVSIDGTRTPIFHDQALKLRRPRKLGRPLEDVVFEGGLLK